MLYGLIIGNVFHAGDGNLHSADSFNARSEQFKASRNASKEIMKYVLERGRLHYRRHGVAWRR